MKSETKQKINQILAKLDDGSEITAQIESAQLRDPMGALRDALYNFFEVRLTKIEEQDIFQKAIEQKLLNRMNEDKLTVGQMIHLYSMLNTESTLKTESLLNIMKARDQAIVPLVVQNQDNQNNHNDYKILDPVKRATINELKEYIKEIIAEDVVEKKGE
ncbi:hypothetical protein LCGC14_1073110 [marine sediment metagenome]|uniref:Uncharacterized protein n=1 Tax=marine sediment metagenome TaxID=412755 RepID=A0A0F9N4Y7_9ZZZZ